MHIFLYVLLKLSITFLSSLSRAKHIKALPHVSLKEDEDTSGLGALPLTKNESCERILEKVEFVSILGLKRHGYCI